MGHLSFGRQEEVRCIRDVDIHGADGEALCLAYKTTTFHFGAGVYLRDDGYVLKVRAQDRYYPLDDEAIRAHQSEAALPTPLPAYEIPFADYVWGVSASGGPSLSTKGDRFIRRGPALETRDVESMERASIRDFQLDGDTVVLELSDGESKRLVTRGREKAFSNQRSLAVEMVRRLDREPGAALQLCGRTELGRDHPVPRDGVSARRSRPESAPHRRLAIAYEFVHTELAVEDVSLEIERIFARSIAPFERDRESPHTLQKL